MTPLEMRIDKLTKMILSKSPVGFLVGVSLLIGVVAPAAAQATGKLNDTGLTTCGDAGSNNVTCAWVDTSLSTAFPRQDPEFGRSAKEDAGTSIAGSDPNSKGFNFTKLAYTDGSVLLSTAVQGVTNTTWGCTKDNVTGLIWDMKVTTASNARLNSNTYVWKNGDAANASNGGVSGFTTATGVSCFSSTCNTEAYVAYINGLGICGESANDWRLPTRAELLGIVNAVNQGGVVDPTKAAVDSFYFPYVMRGSYWTADNVAGNPKDARTVNLAMGSDGVSPKSRPNYVILVRPGSATGTTPPPSYDPVNPVNCKWRSNNLLSTPLADFTDHGDGTVTHNKTGLMWKKCIQGRTYSSGSCAGSTSAYTWQNALKAAANDGTKSVADWRLPSRNELMSILETGCSTPMINTAVFPNIPAAGQFWTSTHAGQNVPDSAWAIRFDNGTSLLKSKAQTGYTLLVRKGQADFDDYWRYPPPVLDTTPDGFIFTDLTGVARSTSTESNTISITGINTLTPISVSGGEYRIGTGGWTSSSGNIANNSTVIVRHITSASFNTATNTTLTVGSVSDTFTTTTEALDTTPNAFSFADQIDVARSTQITSAAVTIGGINSPATISVSGGTYSIGCGADGTYTASGGTISNGQTVCVRHTSSANYLTAVNTTLTVGGVSDIFTSTTLPDPALDTTPNVFAFTDQTAVALNSPIISNTLTITGLGAPAAISVSGGSYSIGCTATFTTTPATISNNQTVCVQHTSAAVGNTNTDTVLTIGGVSDTFRSTTGDATPDAMTAQGSTDVALNTTVRTSTAFTVSGITIASPISVSGAAGSQYCIGDVTICPESGGAFWVSTAGSVTNGQTVWVRHTSSGSELTTATTTLTIGGVQTTFSSTTGDQTPDAMANQSRTDVALTTTVRTTSAFTVGGITIASPISISGATGSQYCVGNTTACPESGGASWVSTAGTITNGQTVWVRHTSSGANSTASTSTLTIGGVPVTFTSTTVAACGTADWDLVAYSNTSSGKSTSYTHPNVVTLTGICTDTPISISSTTAPGGKGTDGQGRYSLNSTTVNTTASGLAQPNDVLRLRFIQNNEIDIFYIDITVGTITKRWQHTTN